jgi:acetoin utilization deacetylase AcuC-like enzyme
LISAGFDAHADDPLADCRLQTGSFAEMARHVRDLARSEGVPLGAVLEGGYEPTALAKSVAGTLAALAGEGAASSAAPEALLTSRAAAQVGHYWQL